MELPSDIDSEEYDVHTIRVKAGPSLNVQMQVDRVILPMELDTGAAVSIVSHAIWQRCFNKLLEKSNFLLTTYSNEKINVIGQTIVQAKYDGQEEILPLIVVVGNGPTLFGRKWLEKIQIDWKSLKLQQVAKYTQTVENLIKKYDELFQQGVGTLKGYKAKLSLKQGAVPKFFKPRSVPHAMKTAIEKNIMK